MIPCDGGNPSVLPEGVCTGLQLHDHRAAAGAGGVLVEAVGLPIDSEGVSVGQHRQVQRRRHRHLTLIGKAVCHIPAGLDQPGS